MRTKHHFCSDITSCSSCSSCFPCFSCFSALHIWNLPCPSTLVYFSKLTKTRMSPNDNAGRIHRVPLMVCILSVMCMGWSLEYADSDDAKQVTSITLFILALLAVLARILIRLRSKNPISTDDALLYFGVICLSAAMALLVDLSKPLYLDEALSTSFPETELPPNYIKLLMRFHKVADVYLALTCTAIFSVKFSFLFFFRILVQRVQKMNVYWWTVTGVMVVAWVVTMIVAIFLPCPYFDLRSCTAWVLVWSVAPMTDSSPSKLRSRVRTSKDHWSSRFRKYIRHRNRYTKSVRFTPVTIFFFVNSLTGC